MASLDALGQKIRSLRMAKGLSQQQMADLMFVTRKTISNWEAGTRMPDLAMLSRLAKALDVRTFELLDAISGEDTPPCVIMVEDEPIILKGFMHMLSDTLAINPRINIIFLTGHSEYTAEALALHCSGYILKPLTPEKIRQEIEHLRYPVRGLNP